MAGPRWRAPAGYLGALALLLLALYAAAPGGRDGGEAPGPAERPLQAEIQGLAEEGRRLDARLPHHRARQEAKWRVTAEVEAGRLSLWEAAARFRDLNAPDPVIVEATRLTWEGRPYEECLCRNVIRYVRRDGHPDLADRLEKELGMRLKDGPLRLPE